MQNRSDGRSAHDASHMRDIWGGALRKTLEIESCYYIPRELVVCARDLHLGRVYMRFYKRPPLAGLRTLRAYYNVKMCVSVCVCARRCVNVHVLPLWYISFGIYMSKDHS